MSQGYVYVLVNAAMPGLVKIGCTTRDPNERADKLSTPTGIATPFIIAYVQEFSDCARAERTVHARLADRGMRVLDRREFFRCTPSEAIRTIIALAASEAGPHPDLPAGDNRIALMIAEGDSWRDGRNGRSPNAAEALRWYNAALNLGAIEAYRHRGELYAHSTKGFSSRALREFKAGAMLGDIFCWIELAALAAGRGDRKRFERSAAHFFAESGLPDTARAPGLRADQLRDAAIRYLALCQDQHWPPVHVPVIRPMADAIHAAFLARAADLPAGSEAARELTRRARYCRVTLRKAPALTRLWQGWRIMRATRERGYFSPSMPREIMAHA